MSEPRKRAIGYVRVSTEEQKESGLGIDAQINAIKTECINRDWDFEIVMDLGCSGKHINPELRRALDLLRAGRADALVVTKMDRLARSVQHAVTTMNTAMQQGWNLIFIDQALDLTTPQGRMVATILAGFAEFEREMISTRTKEALAERKRNNLPNGRKSAIPASVRDRIWSRRENGASFGLIASELEAEGHLSPMGLPSWSESTVRRAYMSMQRTQAPASV